MVVCRKPLILTTDLIGLGALAALIAFAIAFVAIPYSDNRGELPRLRAAVAEVERQERSLSARNRTMFQSVERLEGTLREEGAQPLADVATLLEHMSRQCERHGIDLQTVHPLPAVSGETYDSWDIRVEARGAYPDFVRLLQRIEGGSPYVHVREIHVRGPKQPADRDCGLSWTIRVNYLPQWATRRGKTE